MNNINKELFNCNWEINLVEIVLFPKRVVSIEHWKYDNYYNWTDQIVKNNKLGFLHKGKTNSIIFF